MKLLILFALVVTSQAAPAAQSLTVHDDGSYRFYYETGEEGGRHSRTEVRHPDGSVVGKFAYQDPDGEMREVNYKADESGFITQGDVGVQGAPKGQFPAVIAEQSQEETPSAAVTNEELSAEPKDEEPQPSEAESSYQDVSREDVSHQDDDNRDEMQDLTLEESAVDYPPEGFPPGFFLQKFQGLRRLPEPTKEPKPATTESPKTDKPAAAEEETKPAKENKEQPEEPSTAGEVKSGEQPNVFAPLSPFHGLSPQEWATSMFHQPVYVFSYNQPDSYGYHYFF